MEREIKFREFVNGKFHYWGFVQEGIFKGPVTPSLTRGQHSQFTGLLDKNGKEIYENDILKLDDVLGEVTYSDGSFQMILDSSAGRSPILQERTKQFIIIGNRWENPGLIN